MPRPRRTTVRKSVPPPKPLSPSPSDAEPNPPPNSQTLIAGKPEEETTLPESVPENTSTALNAAETLASAEDVVNNTTKAIETVINDSDEHNKDNINGSAGGAKPKKVVKKTIKVLRKVIKKVPKKGVDEFNNVDNAEELGAVNAISISDALKPDSNRESEGLVGMEVEENKHKGEEGGVGQVEGGSGSGSGSVEEVDNGEGENEGEEKEEEKGKEGEERKLFSGELEAMERRKRRKTEVFVGGLDKEANEDDVRKVFQEAGEIVDLRVVTSNKTGNKFAFLRYGCAEDAKKALDTFAKVKIYGKECAATPVEGNDTIYLGNIDKNWKEEDVSKLLNKIGIDKIDKVIVMIDPNNSNCNRGFAFIEFESIRDAQVAYTKLQEKDVFGKNVKLKVAWAEPLKELDEEEMLKVKTVYAEFIPASWDEEKLKDTFKKFGEIDDIVLARNLRTSKRKDFAFISYQTRVAAVKCIESFGNDLRDEDGTKVNVKVSLAKPISKGKVKQAAKPVAKKVPRASSKISHSNFRPSDTRNRTHPSVLRYGIHNPEASSTNVELVRLLREQASWRPPHANLSNSPMDIHYNPLSGRKRLFSLLETGPLSGELNRYPPSYMDDRYSVASSSHNVLPPSDLTNPMASHHRLSGYPFGSHYGARNYATNIETRDRGRGSSFLHRPR